MGAGIHWLLVGSATAKSCGASVEPSECTRTICPAGAPLPSPFAVNSPGATGFTVTDSETVKPVESVKETVAGPEARLLGITILACVGEAKNMLAWRAAPAESVTVMDPAPRLVPNNVTSSSGANASVAYEAALPAASGT